MTPKQFCYWLDGSIQVLSKEPQILTADDVLKQIRDKLAEVEELNLEPNAGSGRDLSCE